MSELSRRIGLLKELPATNELRSHLGRERRARSVQHPHSGLNRDALIGDVIASARQRFEAYIDKQRVDKACRRQMNERFAEAVGRERDMPQVLNYTLGALPNEYFILDDQNYRHVTGMFMQHLIQNNLEIYFILFSVFV
jgi:hypothetical protein